ncbi:DUF5984 family protein [Deinococcus arenicola]|uniref:DUF5984 family protein n=1 Tax=Deinococcus arenicola TaxID=2994950 RepID=A0ABU4DSX7_9DEIO|nr:DUF5984 family protein [Deinococcus sp. ZS9-10]MDV6375067.1 DUF5984 family protein [Deinococcus sp. ZS9-10]
MPVGHPEFNAAFELPADLDPHLAYPVARLWTDLNDMLPGVLEAIPDELVEALRSGRWDEWRAQATNWFDELSENDERAGWDNLYDAVSWSGARTLDMGYLAAPPQILLWRSGETVTLSWDTRDGRIDDVLCWLESQGSLRLPVTQFLAEVEDFRARLDAAMRQRMQEVAALNFLDAAALTDLERQHQVTLSGEGRHPENVDWDVVFKAIRQLEGWSGMYLIPQ